MVRYDRERRVQRAQTLVLIKQTARRRVTRSTRGGPRERSITRDMRTAGSKLINYKLHRMYNIG